MNKSNPKFFILAVVFELCFILVGVLLFYFQINLKTHQARFVLTKVTAIPCVAFGSVFFYYFLMKIDKHIIAEYWGKQDTEYWKKHTDSYYQKMCKSNLLRKSEKILSQVAIVLSLMIMAMPLWLFVVLRFIFHPNDLFK